MSICYETKQKETKQTISATERYRKRVESQGRTVRKMTYIDISREFLESCGITAVLQVEDNLPENQYGWTIWSGKNQVLVFDHITQKFKNGGFRSSPYVCLKTQEGKQKLLSLSSIVYAWFVDTIPASYVVDHIDNDSYNNVLTNLELLTRGANVRKDACGHNQYTPEELRRHKNNN